MKIKNIRVHSFNIPSNGIIFTNESFKEIKEKRLPLIKNDFSKENEIIGYVDNLKITEDGVYFDIYMDKSLMNKNEKTIAPSYICNLSKNNRVEEIKLCSTCIKHAQKENQNNLFK